MGDAGKSATLAGQALWHMCMAIWLLQRISERSEKTSANPRGAGARARKQRAGKNAAAPVPPLQSLLEGSNDEDCLTVDVLEIHGRLGTDDQRALKINGKSPVKLDRREHAILVILAWLAKCAAARAATGKQLPVFLPVKAILEVILALIAPEGLLHGRWSAPIESDIYRSVNKLRGRLKKRGFNASIIQSGHRGAGYRLSTPVTHILFSSGQEQPISFWSDLLDAALAQVEVQEREARAKREKRLNSAKTRPAPGPEKKDIHRGAPDTQSGLDCQANL